VEEKRATVAEIGEVLSEKTPREYVVDEDVRGFARGGTAASDVDQHDR
jgi:hypothetical protein